MRPTRYPSRVAANLAVLLVVGLLAPNLAATDRAATPVTGPVDAVAPVETLVDLAVTQPVPEPAFLGLTRLIVPPGVEVPGGRVPGLRVIVVERGVLTVQLGSGSGVGGGLDPSAEIVAGQEQRVDAGDFVAVPSEVQHRIHNSSTTPVTALDLVVLPASPPNMAPETTETGIVFQPLMFGEFGSVPASPVRITLERMAPREAATRLTAPGRGPVLIYVASGQVALAPGHHDVGFRRSAAPLPGSRLGPLEPLSPTQTIALSAGAVIQVSSGATIEFGSDTHKGATMLVLAVSTAN